LNRKTRKFAIVPGRIMTNYQTLFHSLNDVGNRSLFLRPAFLR
jgi:hypothetical protein